jgi:TolB protein
VPGSANAEFPRWSPDGSKISFMSSVQGNWDIYTVNPDGSGLTRLTSDPAFDGYANWSPDGSRLVFIRGGDAGMFVMNADGSGVTHLGPGTRPSWSPDGSKIVFELDFNLWLMNADGSGVSPLSERPEAEYEPAWSPDGERIAFVDDVPGPWLHHLAIMVLNLQTWNLTEISGSLESNSSPRWSPDSSQVVFSSLPERSAAGELYSVRTDGSELVQLTSYSGADWNPDWGLTTPLPPLPPPPPPPPAPRNCVVPRVVGLRLVRARMRISRARCSVGRVRRTRSRRVGRVVAQSPAPGTRRPVRSRINLVVGRR